MGEQRKVLTAREVERSARLIELQKAGNRAVAMLAVEDGEVGYYIEEACRTAQQHAARVVQLVEAQMNEMQREAAARGGVW